MRRFLYHQVAPAWSHVIHSEVQDEALAIRLPRLTFPVPFAYMNWLERAENKFGHLAIPGLPWMIAMLNLVVFVLYKFDASFLDQLALNPALVMRGEVWRLITFLFIPNLSAFLLPEWFVIVLYILFLLFIGGGLEQAMGAFRLNLYYGLGALGTIAAGFFFGGNYGNTMLNTSLLFAFAYYYPDATILLYFIPAKVRWVAWFSAAVIAYGFVVSSWDLRASILVAFLNYWIFFGFEHVRNARQHQMTAGRRGRFQREVEEVQREALHQCVVCQRTENTAPELEFRVSRDGLEYCREHLPKPAAATG